MLSEADGSAMYDSDFYTPSPVQSSSVPMISPKENRFNQPSRLDDGPRFQATYDASTPLYRGMNFYDVEQPVGDSVRLEQVLADFTFYQKLRYLLKHRPSYLVYLFFLLTMCGYYISKFSRVWVRDVSGIFVTAAHADPNQQVGTVVNGVDYTPWFFAIIVGMSLVATYAALVSKNTKSNEHGWDMIKILLGSSLGLFPKAK